MAADGDDEKTDAVNASVPDGVPSPSGDDTSGPSAFGSAPDTHISAGDMPSEGDDVSGVRGSSFSDADLGRSVHHDALWRRAGIVGGAVVALGTVVASLVLLVPSSPFALSSGASPGAASAGAKASASAGGVSASGGGASAFYEQKDRYFPVKTAQWAQTTWTTQKASELSAAALATPVSGQLESQAAVLPSEAAGFTSDTSKQTIGTQLNPQFSYWTQESFTSDTSVIMERFLNPMFGGWQQYQYSASNAANTFDVGPFKDMFTPAWFAQANGKKLSTLLPVYADWNSNDYGMSDQLLTSGPRWFGTVDSVATQFTYDSAALQYTVKLTANVTFTAWTKDQSTVTKQGVLTLNLVSNANGANPASTSRVLVDSGNLTVK